MTSKDWQRSYRRWLGNGSLRDRAAAHHTSTATKLVLCAPNVSTNVLRVTACHSITGQKSKCVSLCDAICLTSKDQRSNATMNALRPIQHCDTTPDHSHKTEMENTTPLASSFGLWYRAGRSDNSQVQSWLIHVLTKLTNTCIEATLPHPSAKGEYPLDSLLAFTGTSELGC